MAVEEERQIFVSQIPDSFASEGLLEEYFAQFAEVTSVVVPDSDGSAYIRFASGANLDTLFEDPPILEGQRLNIELCEEGDPKPLPKRRRVDSKEGPLSGQEGWDSWDGEKEAGDAAEEPKGEALDADGFDEAEEKPAEDDWAAGELEEDAPLDDDQAAAEAAGDMPDEGAEAGSGRGASGDFPPVQNYRRGARYHEEDQRQERPRHVPPRGGGGKGDSQGSSQNGTSVEREKIFVGGLQGSVTEKDIYDHFNYYAKPKWVNMKSGFAYVTFSSDEPVRKILADFDKHRINGRWVECRTFGRFSKCEPGQPILKDRIFIGGIDRDTQPEKIRKYFSQYDAVDKVEFKWERGFGFVIFKSGAGVQLSLLDHAHHKLDGRWFDVQPCIDKAKEKGGEKGGKGGDKGDDRAARDDRAGPASYSSGKGGGKKSGHAAQPPSEPPPGRSWDRGQGKGRERDQGSSYRGSTDRGSADRGSHSGGGADIQAAIRRRAPPDSRPGSSDRGGPREIPPRGGYSSREAVSQGRPSTPSASSSGGGAGGPSGSPEEWTAGGVQRFLKSEGLEEACSIFAEQEVTGKVLLSLTEEDLKGEFGIQKFGLRRQIKLAVEELRRDNGRSSGGGGGPKAAGKGKTAPSGKVISSRSELLRPTHGGVPPAVATGLAAARAALQGKGSSQREWSGSSPREWSGSSQRESPREWSSKGWQDSGGYSSSKGKGKDYGKEHRRSRPY